MSIKYGSIAMDKGKTVRLVCMACHRFDAPHVMVGVFPEGKIYRDVWECTLCGERRVYFMRSGSRGYPIVPALENWCFNRDSRFAKESETWAR